MSKVITIEIRGLNELRRSLIDYPKISLPIVKEAFKDIGSIFLQRSLLLPTGALPQKKGDLRKSFKYQYGNTWGLFYSDPKIAPYAIYVHEGTRPHPIYPKSGRALAFQWEKKQYYTASSGRRYHQTLIFKRGDGLVKKGKGQVSDKAVFRHVNHPGTKPKPFMEHIGSQSRPLIMNRLKLALEQTMQEIAKQTNVR